MASLLIQQVLLYIRFKLLFLLLCFVGNVYVADSFNHRIRKVTVSTGIITTFAGTGTSSFSGDGGDATSAALYSPFGVSLDSSGNLLLLLLLSLQAWFISFRLPDNVYIADELNNRIRKVTVGGTYSPR